MHSLIPTSVSRDIYAENSGIRPSKNLGLKCSVTCPPDPLHVPSSYYFLVYACSLQEELETEKVKIVCEIEELHHFMHEQERLLVARLDALQEKIVRRRDERVAQFSEDIAHLDDLITEVVEKCQQPAVEFLQVRAEFFVRFKERDVRFCQMGSKAPGFHPLGFQEVLKHIRAYVHRSARVTKLGHA